MKRIVIFIIICLTFPAMRAQPDSSVAHSLEKFVGNSQTFNRLFPQEKVYLHFDNTGYYLEETIWFKAYLVLAENHIPSPLSNVLYVELLTPEGDVFETKKLKVEAGQSHGEFVLHNPLLHAGFYEIRAYTKAMLNFGEATVFSRVFPVFNKTEQDGKYDQKMTLRSRNARIPVQRPDAPKLKTLNLSFFPEGGNLIAGLPCRVAFKATDTQGKSATIAGKIYDANKNEIATFASVHQGMGQFELMPKTGKYKAKAIYNDKEYEFDLPPVVPQGYNMTVDNSCPDTLAVEIRKTPDRQAGDTLGITFSCRGKFYVFDILTFDVSNTCFIRAAKSLFPTGVAQITLFNVQGNILSERLAYVNHHEQTQIAVATMQSAYQPYAPVAIDFVATDHLGMPLETTFSLAVRDAATTIQTAPADNIRTYLLLSSDLKGYIENPEYYFESDDAAHQSALDLLVQVQGWQRYDWQQSAGVKPFEVKHYIEKEILIEGKVLSVFKHQPEENVEVTMWMSSNEQRSLRGKCLTDKDGKFNFALGDLYGKWDLSLQTKQKSKRKQKSIILDRNISPPPKYFTAAESHLPEPSNTETLEVARINDAEVSEIGSTVLPEDSIKAHLLAEVLVKEKKTFKAKDYGLARASIAYDVVAETDKILDRGEYFVEDVRDFLLRTNHYFSFYSNPKMDSIGQYALLYKGRQVTYLVDNTAIENSSWLHIDDIKMSDIESIMISENVAFSMKDYVDVYIYLSAKSRQSPKGIRNTSLTGYNKPAEFYHPAYNNYELPAESDFRRTLYWNPNVKTDRTGKASVHFYNNSLCKALDISAEGLIFKL